MSLSQDARTSIRTGFSPATERALPIGIWPHVAAIATSASDIAIVFFVSVKP